MLTNRIKMKSHHKKLDEYEDGDIEMNGEESQASENVEKLDDIVVTIPGRLDHWCISLHHLLVRIRPMLEQVLRTCAKTVEGGQV